MKFILAVDDKGYGVEAIIYFAVLKVGWRYKRLLDLSARIVTRSVLEWGKF